MPARLRPWLSSALLGLSVGAVWEALGNTFLWTLASPQLLVYLLALIAWFFLGVGHGRLPAPYRAYAAAC
ncbi:MAG: hypothetical protein ACRERE_39835 [Candidatus Entotheonellia bacterium]